MKTNSKFATLAHVSSESGDHYLMTLEGKLTADEVKVQMDWEEPDCLWVRELEVIEFTDE